MRLWYVGSFFRKVALERRITKSGVFCYIRLGLLRNKIERLFAKAWWDVYHMSISTSLAPEDFTITQRIRWKNREIILTASLKDWDERTLHGHVFAIIDEIRILIYGIRSFRKKTDLDMARPSSYSRHRFCSWYCGSGKYAGSVCVGGVRIGYIPKLGVV